jgi:hypothetical protein
MRKVAQNDAPEKSLRCITVCFWVSQLWYMLTEIVIRIFYLVGRHHLLYIVRILFPSKLIFASVQHQLYLCPSDVYHANHATKDYGKS